MKNDKYLDDRVDRILEEYRAGVSDPRTSEIAGQIHRAVSGDEPAPEVKRPRADDSITRVLNKRYRTKTWQKVVSALSAIVVFWTTYALVLPAITKENQFFCGMEEHTHDESCYDDGLLTCGHVEHVHTEACLSDPEADVETEQDWTVTIPQLTGDRALDLSAVAESQLGYTESEKNFAVSEDGLRLGYTRYGTWYGNSYGDWNTAFVAFCLHYSGNDSYPTDESAELWQNMLIAEEKFHIRETAALGLPAADGDTHEDVPSAEPVSNEPEVTPAEPAQELEVAPDEPAQEPEAAPDEPAQEPEVAPVEPAQEPEVAPDEPAQEPEVAPVEPAQEPEVTPDEPAQEPEATPVEPAQEPEATPEEPDTANTDTAPVSELYIVQPGDIVFFGKGSDAKVATRVGVITAIDEEKGELTVIEGDADGVVAERLYSMDDGSIVGFGELYWEPLEAVAGTAALKGEGYSLTLSYDVNACIPENAEFTLDELDAAALELYASAIRSAWPNLTGTEADEVYSAAFGITVMQDGARIAPKAPIKYELYYETPVVMSSAEGVHILDMSRSRPYDVELGEVKTGGTWNEVTGLVFETDALTFALAYEPAAPRSLELLMGENTSIMLSDGLKQVGVELAPGDIVNAWVPEDSALTLTRTEDGADFEIGYKEPPQEVFIPDLNTVTVRMANGVRYSLLLMQKAFADGELTFTGEDYTIRMSYGANAHIPEGASIIASEIPQDSETYTAYYSKAEDALDRSVVFARIFDIKIMMGDREIMPAAPVQVNVSFKETEAAPAAEDYKAVHFETVEETAEPAVKQVLDAVSNDAPEAHDVSFEAEGFSVYAILGTERLILKYITADEETYYIMVTYDQKAMIPEGSYIQASELDPEAPETAAYAEQAAAAVSLGENPPEVKSVKLFDISIMGPDGTEVQPQAPVTVDIRYGEIGDLAEVGVISAVHFTEAGTEVIEAKRNGAWDAFDAVTFKARAFSVYAIVGAGELPDKSIRQTFEDDRFIITAAYGPDTKIPEGAVFTASLITPENDPERYESRLAQFEEYCAESKLDATLTDLLKMGFHMTEAQADGTLAPTGAEVEPATTVYLTIFFKDTQTYYQGAPVELIHFTDFGAEFSGFGCISEDGTAEFKAKSFSDFGLTANQNSVFYTEPVSDYTNVEILGNSSNFMASLPYGTVYIDYDAMNFANYPNKPSYPTTATQTANLPSTATTRYTGTHTSRPEVSVTVEILNSNFIFSDASNDGGDRPGIHHRPTTGENGFKLPGNTQVTHNGDVARITYSNVAILADGTTADVVVTISNTELTNTMGSTSDYHMFRRYIFSGNWFLPSAGKDGNTAKDSSNASTGAQGARMHGSMDMNIKVVPNSTSGTISDKTFLFGINDYDIPDRSYIKGAFTLNVGNNPETGAREVRGVMIPNGGGSNVPISGYVNSNGVTKTSVKFAQRGYLDPSDGETGPHFSVPITDPEERVPLYNAGGQRLYWMTDPNGPDFDPLQLTAVPTAAQRAWPAYPLYKTAYYSNNNGTFRFWTVSMVPAVSESATILSGNTSKLFIPSDSVLFVRGKTVYPTRNDGETVKSGYVTVVAADQGITFRASASGNAQSMLTSSNMFYTITSITHEGGTISTSDVDIQGNQTAYDISRAGLNPGTNSGLLAVPRGKTATYTMTPQPLYRPRSVKIYQGSSTSPSVNVDLTDPSIWSTPDSNGVSTYTTNGFTFSRDANGVITYVFTNVSVNWTIEVDWEPQPMNAVTIVKSWNDNNNARNSRPNDLVVHVYSDNGATIEHDSSAGTSSELVTGTHSNVYSTYSWLKTGSQWTYTFPLDDNVTPSSGTNLYFYEEEPQDYEGQAAGAGMTAGDGASVSKPVRITNITENTDPLTGVKTYLYEAAITNTRLNGNLIFKKADAGGAGVPAAEFTLYTDPRCEFSTNITSSEQNGEVKFLNVPCGMYYMKETNVPTYGTGGASFASTTQIYRVFIHNDSTLSTVEPVTVTTNSSGGTVVTPSTPVTKVHNDRPTTSFSVTKDLTASTASMSQAFDIAVKFYSIFSYNGNTVKNPFDASEFDYTLTPASGAPTTGKISTDSSGVMTLTLHHGDTIKIDGIPVEVEYELTETPVSGFKYVKTELTGGTTDTTFTDPTQSTPPGPGPVKGTITAANGPYAVKVYNVEAIDIKLIKHDMNQQEIEGSEFKLSRKNTNGIYEVVTGYENVPVPIGGVTFTELQPGDYELEETKAPNGYIIWTKRTYFTLGMSATGVDIQIDQTTSPNSYASVDPANSDTIWIANAPGNALPRTGGAGTALFYAVGAAMTGAAGAVLVKRLRRKDD